MEQFDRASREWSFLSYVLHNVETSIAGADPEIMKRYAVLVEDEALREEVLDSTLGEYRTTLEVLRELQEKPPEVTEPTLQPCW